MNDFPTWANNPTAVNLWTAFQRLITGNAKIVRRAQRVTKSSVATEAGYQRSTLSEHRFPDLCKEIRNYNNSIGYVSTAKHAKQRPTTDVSLKKEVEDLKQERAMLLSKLASLELAYIEKCVLVRILER